ncbi:MAG: PP2C family protein-serine/threonine phosphatase [Calditerrivibrio sp.]|nr:PP2C family protein-serine/threonine phosphatase [Calditerrivibrio sp.]MCA1980831.1 PP2C family protein-serine/threonine phosphatase [Calditerrivibrio sp.]
MDCVLLLNFIDSIVMEIDGNYKIKYINDSVKSLVGKSSYKLIDKKCFSAIFGLTEPCQSCQIENIKSGKLPINIIHDAITHRGFRKIYSAKFEKMPNGNFVEIISDITENKKLVDMMTHQTKELKAKNVMLNIQKKEIEKKQYFTEKVLNSTSEGVMVVDTDFNVVFVNYLVKELLNIKDMDLKNFKCYQLYGFDDKCSDCPFTNKLVTKSSRKTNDRNLSVSFNKFENYMVESIRDVTKEIYLIDEIKKQQRELEERQRQMSLLNADLLKMNERLQQAQKTIDDELKQVGEIQASLLPSSLPDISGYEFGALYIPAEHAGGDYYDCIQMSNGYWGFTVADVSGHGTPAAVIMAITRAIMRSYTYDVINASEAIAMVNEILCSNIYTNDFVTMLYIVMNSSTGECNFASAGHNPLLLFEKKSMMVKKVTAQGLFLGVFDDVEYENGSFKLENGDIAFMYTDGLVEAMNPEDELYGYDNLISKLIMFSELSCDTIINNIMEDVKNFCRGRKFNDDITILVIRKKEA